MKTMITFWGEYLKHDTLSSIQVMENAWICRIKHFIMFKPYKPSLSIRWLLLLGGILIYCISVDAQRGRNSSNNLILVIPDNQLGLIEDSNTVKKLLREHIRPQLVKQIWMDRDTALKYIYQGLEISKRIGYEWGIQKMYKCLSSAYRSKGPQDSAQFYFRHIINRAEDQCDTGDIIFYLVQLGRSFSLESK
ncbi:MAG: hypothetical protein ABIQ11_05040, partial [Saprospiraceae bacterium]